MKAIFILWWRLVLTKVTGRINTEPAHPMPLGEQESDRSDPPASVVAGLSDQTGL